MSTTLKFPFYAKLFFVLTSLMALFTILYLGQNIIFPIFISLFIAILLMPINDFFEKKCRFSSIFAAFFSVTIFVLLFLVVIWFISWEISDIANDWESIKTNIFFHIDTLQESLKSNFNLSEIEQKTIIDNASKGSFLNMENMIQNIFSSFTDILLNLTLIPIYIFLFLIYRTHFNVFLHKLFQRKYHQELRTILLEIKISMQSYIVGLLIEMFLVALLTTIGFMIIGLQYAIVLGIITGILHMIPYIGILIAGGLSVIATLTGSPDFSLIFWVIIVISIVQFIDNNFFITFIVGSKVKINAFVSIVGIIIGGAISGFSGMFLAIPITAILKVIFDRIKSLEPWGYFMGDEIPSKKK